MNIKEIFCKYYKEIGFSSFLVTCFGFLDYKDFFSSFDWGGFLGSILAIVGAMWIAKFQVKEEFNQQRKIENEMFYSKMKVDEYYKLKTIVKEVRDKVEEIIHIDDFKENSLTDYIFELEDISKELFVLTFIKNHSKDEEKLYRELNFKEILQDIDNSFKNLRIEGLEEGLEIEKRISKIEDFFEKIYIFQIFGETIQKYNIDKILFKTEEIEYYINFYNEQLNKY